MTATEFVQTYYQEMLLQALPFFLHLMVNHETMGG
jgi:hypothetical protein